MISIVNFLIYASAFSGQYYMDTARQWIMDEAAVHPSAAFDASLDWSLVHRKRAIPQQDNGSDCGMYVIMFADFLSDDLPLSFGPSDMLAFRTKVGCDLMRKRFLYPNHL
jgi:Ulp1 family protease